MLGSFPGTNVFLGIALSGFLCIPLLVTYAMLASAMPRSGGDYIWVSRILHPAIGFAGTSTGTTIFFMCWMAWNGYNLAAIGYGSALGFIGKLTSSSALANIAAWCSGFQGVILISLLSAVVPVLMLVFGMRVFAWLQRGIFVILIAAFAIFVGILAFSTNATFIADFNSFFSYIKPDLYHQVINTASVSTSFSWTDTLVWTAFLGVNFMSCWGFAPMLGEVKKAENLKLVTLAIVLPSFASMIAYALIAWLMFSVFGQTFLASLGSLMASGNQLISGMPFQPYWIYLPLLIVPNVFLIVLFGIVMMSVYVFWVNSTNILPPSRYIFAQSFDRILPKVFGYVHPTRHVPLVAMAVSAIGGIIWIVWSNFAPSVWIFTAAAAIATIVCQMVPTLVSGIVFPFRAPEIYKASPCGKYNVAGVPLISIVGLLGLVWALAMTYFYLSIAALGAQVPVSYYAIVCFFAGGVVLYFVSKWYRTREGFDLSLAFHEIPPL